MSNQEESDECGMKRDLTEQRTVDESEHYSTVAEPERTSENQLLSLDDHLLLHICEYLELDTLLSLCQVNRRLKELIKLHRIYRERIKLEANRRGNYALTILDILPNATRLFITLNNQNLNKTLETIASRCDDGKLKEIRIVVQEDNLPIVDSHHHLMREKLKNVNKLEIFGADNETCVKIDSNFTTLFMNPNLESISLTNTPMTTSCLIAIETLQNLKSLELKLCADIPYERFSEVLRKIGGQITSFTWYASEFFEYNEQHRLCNLVKSTMPNLNELWLMEHFGLFHLEDEIYITTSLNELLALTKLHSLTLDVLTQCKCKNYNLFINRLCSSRPIKKLDFSWHDMFTSSGLCSRTNEEMAKDRCESLSGVQDLRLGCDFFSIEWDVFENVLPNLREISFFDQPNFEDEGNRERFKLILKLGLKLDRVTMHIDRRLPLEFYKALVQICKSDRAGKGITIHVRRSSARAVVNYLGNIYESKYVRIIEEPFEDLYYY